MIREKPALATEMEETFSSRQRAVDRFKELTARLEADPSELLFSQPLPGRPGTR